MSVSEMKHKLHELIENTDDAEVLENAYRQLSAPETVDWWDDLSIQQQQRLAESEQQYKTGKVVANEAVLIKIQAWLQK